MTEFNIAEVDLYELLEIEIECSTSDVSNILNWLFLLIGFSIIVFFSRLDQKSL